uniref:Uncharacterized protein n=1 Tax=Hippocampus comes TaxID=109280 RepID=A0A3Q3E8M2_HIPCM
PNFALRLLVVSMGHTMTIASVIPAPKPHRRLRVLSSRPVASLRIGECCCFIVFRYNLCVFF